MANGGGGGRGGRGGGRTGGKGVTAPEDCPDCGGPMWDNSDRPGKKPTAPDYVCKQHNGECNGAVWLRDREKNAEQGRAQATGAPQEERILVLDSLFAVCIDAAGKILADKMKPIAPVAGAPGAIDAPSRHDQLVVAAALFNARSRFSRGILKVEKEGEVAAARKREEEERRRREEEASHQGAGQYSDGLPF